MRGDTYYFQAGPEDPDDNTDNDNYDQLDDFEQTIDNEIEGTDSYDDHSQGDE